jgi:hypothetical protein
MSTDDILLSLVPKHSGRLRFWTSFVQAVNAKTCAEVGVWKGRFAEALLVDCPSVDRFYLIDAWRHLPHWSKPLNVADETFDDIYSEAMAKTAFAANRRVVLRGTTTEVVNQIPADSLDFAYLDGDHTLRGITIDLACVFPRVRTGGYLAGDDFDGTVWRHGFSFEPTMVFPLAVYFAEAMDVPIHALPGSQFLIEKSFSGYRFHDWTGQYSASPEIREQLSFGRLFGAGRATIRNAALHHRLRARRS